MEARSVLALTSGLCAAGISAAMLGALVCAQAERRFDGIARLGLAGKPPEELALMAKARVEEKLIRIPHLGDSLRKARAVRKRNQVRKSLPEAIRLLCISLDSGSSLGKALEYAADNCTGAIAKELKAAVWGLQAGQSFDEVMAHLRARTGGSEFTCLSVAMEIQHRCGGTLIGILEEVSAMLQQASELEDELVTKTTQAQLSARVVALMPVVVMVLLTVISPGYLSQFVESPVGIAMLVLAIALELVGVILVKRSLKLDIGMGEG